MTSIQDAVAQMLAQAESMRDEQATRVLHGLRDNLAESAQTENAESDTANDDPDTPDPHGDNTATALVHLHLEERSRLARALIVAQPEATARLRSEADVLTLVLTPSGR